MREYGISLASNAGIILILRRHKTPEENERLRLLRQARLPSAKLDFTITFTDIAGPPLKLDGLFPDVSDLNDLDVILATGFQQTNQQTTGQHVLMVKKESFEHFKLEQTLAEDDVGFHDLMTETAGHIDWSALYVDHDAVNPKILSRQLDIETVKIAEVDSFRLDLLVTDLDVVFLRDYGGLDGIEWSPLPSIDELHTLSILARDPSSEMTRRCIEQEDHMLDTNIEDWVLGFDVHMNEQVIDFAFVPRDVRDPSSVPDLLQWSYSNFLRASERFRFWQISVVHRSSLEHFRHGRGIEDNPHFTWSEADMDVLKGSLSWNLTDPWPLCILVPESSNRQSTVSRILDEQNLDELIIEVSHIEDSALQATDNCRSMTILPTTHKFENSEMYISLNGLMRLHLSQRHLIKTLQGSETALDFSILLPHAC
eukprot:Clim_evm175s157 gene=Clim_evmTU175s157